MPTKYLIPIFLILVCCSFGVHHFIPAYLPIGDQLLVNNTFSQGEQGWKKSPKQQSGKITIKPNHVILATKTNSQPSFLQVFQTIDANKLSTKVLFNASAKSTNIITGEHGWNQASVMLVQYINQKAVYSLSSQLVSINGTTRWKEYNQTFTIDPKTEYIAIKLIISKASGEMQCRDISLFNAAVNPLYTKFRVLIFNTWALFCLTLFLPYLRKSRLLAGLIFITLATLLFGITMNVQLKNTMKNHIYTKLDKSREALDNKLQKMQSQSRPTSSLPQKQTLGIPDQSFKEHSLDITKLAHLLIFMSLAIFLKRTGAKTSYQVILDILLLACITEIFQLFIEGRSALLRDVIIDFGGGLAGTTIVSLFSRHRSKTP